MKDQLAALRQSAGERIAAAADSAALDAVRVAYLGKKGGLTAILKQMGGLSAEERPVIGQLANEVRAQLEALLHERGEQFKAGETARRLAGETLDITMPGAARALGHKHPLSIVLDEVKEIFLGMGFSVAAGPEVENEYYNFTALNIPEGHIARDDQDTFYTTGGLVLRSATSSAQVRYMERHKPPIRVLVPGRVYRKDTPDATHSPLFHQIEGLVVDEGVTMGHLKSTLDLMLKGLFGESTRTRLRPHYFPFTEPSCEVDVSCFRCGGAGCVFCKGEGWVELLGAGMVHPNVLRAGGIDPEKYSGFAFGVGLDRLTLIRFQIDDIRLLFENDLRFLGQF
ncbi:MAG: phenylalanine--tRNA ligase subunit alpha [Oscillospiraceae bacterium]|jgi:phenylalanyl-tRNA synthetase alpha chain|nr:phenylalanine--tRNA ligase subunit alpha [Oscillospiraceae bacterium]